MLLYLICISVGIMSSPVGIKIVKNKNKSDEIVLLAKIKLKRVGKFQTCLFFLQKDFARPKTLTNKH